MISGVDLHEQLSWHWEARLRPRLDGLSDAECFWEPAAGCWTVDEHGPQGSWPTPDPAPITTIAWRLSHLGALLTQRASAHFGDRDQQLTWPSTAAEALALVDTGYAAWSAGVLTAEPERFARPHQGPPGSADERYPLWAVLLHVNTEVIHHGAEVALLRDLWRAAQGPAG